MYIFIHFRDAGAVIIRPDDEHFPESSVPQLTHCPRGFHSLRGPVSDYATDRDCEPGGRADAATEAEFRDKQAGCLGQIRVARGAQTGLNYGKWRIMQMRRD